MVGPTDSTPSSSSSESSDTYEETKVIEGVKPLVVQGDRLVPFDPNADQSGAVVVGGRDVENGETALFNLVDVDSERQPELDDFFTDANNVKSMKPGEGVMRLDRCISKDTKTFDYQGSSMEVACYDTHWPKRLARNAEERQWLRSGVGFVRPDQNGWSERNLYLFQPDAAFVTSSIGGEAAAQLQSFRNNRLSHPDVLDDDQVDTALLIQAREPDGSIRSGFSRLYRKTHKVTNDDPDNPEFERLNDEEYLQELQSFLEENHPGGDIEFIVYPGEQYPISKDPDTTVENAYIKSDENVMLARPTVTLINSSDEDYPGVVTQPENRFATLNEAHHTEEEILSPYFEGLEETRYNPDETNRSPKPSSNPPSESASAPKSNEKADSSPESSGQKTNGDGSNSAFKDLPDSDQAQMDPTL